MLIGRDKEYVEIVELERIPDTLPTPGDVRVEVTVRLQDFGGRYGEVWLAQPDLVKFVRDFEAVVTAGSGRAVLEAMSPDELTLEFEQLTTEEHVRLHVRLGRYQYSWGWDTYWPTSVEGGFEVASCALPSILAGFQALLD